MSDMKKDIHITVTTTRKVKLPMLPNFIRDERDCKRHMDENPAPGTDGDATNASPKPQAPAVAVPKRKVFSHGPWVFQETGQSFTGAELDDAAYEEYITLEQRRSAPQAPAEPPSESPIAVSAFQVAGLVSKTDHDSGIVELRFVNERAAQDFMSQYEATVDELAATKDKP